MKARRLFLISIALISWFAISPVISAVERPDVLLIAIDDLNDWIEPLGGHPQAITPNLNRLARRSVVFTNAHCQAPICNPSRVSLLTGTYPSTTGIYFLTPTLRQHAATAHATTLPQHFARNGYVTIGGGKIFHGPAQQEFEEFAGNFGGFGPRPSENLNCRHVHPLWDWGAFPATNLQMPDHRLAEWAAEEIRKVRQRPRFLAVGFFRPHVPLYVPQEWFDRYPLESVKLPADDTMDDLADISTYARDLTYSSVAPRHEWMVEQDQWRRAVQAYLASISFVDAQVGRLLDALEESGNAERTVIVLWSDHGFHLGTKRRWGKRSLWEAATQVPLMISYPGLQPAGHCDRPVGLIDLFPTLKQLCDLDDVTGLEGRSLVPLLEDPQSEWPFPAITTFGQNNHAVRSQHFRYIQYANGQQELYDHRSDPNEHVNLINEDNVSDIIADHRRWLPQVNQPMAPGSSHLDARPGSEPDIDGPPSFQK